MISTKKKRCRNLEFNRATIVDNGSPFAYLEGYKSLRTNLNFLSYGEEVKTILVTSSVANEGKSTVAINLARVLSMSGHSVLLMDADLRAPSIQKYLKMSSVLNDGLSSVLAGNVPLKKAIIKHPSNHCDVLLSGPIPPNPVELLSRGFVKRILYELKECYDYIIIDAPPVGIVTDAKVLSQSVDGLLYIVRQNYAEKDAIKRISSDLTSSGINVLGIVFNHYTEKKHVRNQYFNRYG